MKLLDNLILTLLTTLVSITSVSKCSNNQEVETITIKPLSVSSNTIQFKWTYDYDSTNKNSCGPLKITGGTNKNPKVINNISAKCEDSPYNNRCKKVYSYTENDLTECTMYTFTIICTPSKSYSDTKDTKDYFGSEYFKPRMNKKTIFELNQITLYNSPMQPVTNIRTTDEVNLIKIQWNESSEHKLCINEYLIEIYPENGNKISKTTKHNGFLLTDLKAGQKYVGNVTAKYSEDKNITTNFKEFTIAAEFIKPVFNVRAESEESKTIFLYWSRPNINENYNFSGYEIFYNIITNDPNKNQKQNEYCTEDFIKIQQLEACKYYNISVMPKISEFGNDILTSTVVFVLGDDTCMFETLNGAVLDKFRFDENENKLYIPNELFQSFEEKILNYSIFVHNFDIDMYSKNWPSKNGRGTPYTWAEMILNPSKVFDYRATPDDWPHKTDINGELFFIIGENIKCNKNDLQLFCNGPLEEKNYELKVRACTKRGCKNSRTKNFIFRKSLNKNVDSYVSSLKLFVLIFAGLLIGFGSYFIHRVIRNTEYYDSKHSMINRTAPSDINIKQLRAITLEEMEIEYSRFDVHFKSNPSRNIAMLPKNLSKNRYSDILPYDFNRVELKSGDNDYINASFIYDFDKVQKYIACQGPMKNTCVDMWQMVLEQNVVSIVMLCKIIENAKTKCEKYFPSVNEELQFGDIIVKNNRTVVDNHRSFTINKLRVTKGNEQKEINHFQFHDWPDFGTPDEYSILSDFRKNINAVSSDGLIVVHCSAGVGRTGTYIACDMLINSYSVNKKLNVFKTILHLRKQRANMVQTQEQYNFIYGFLGNVLTSHS